MRVAVLVFFCLGYFVVQHRSLCVNDFSGENDEQSEHGFSSIEARFWVGSSLWFVPFGLVLSTLLVD